MTLTEHLVELRRRLIISVIAVALGTFVAFFLYNLVLHFITAPTATSCSSHPSKDISQRQPGRRPGRSRASPPG